MSATTATLTTTALATHTFQTFHALASDSDSVINELFDTDDFLDVDYDDFVAAGVAWHAANDSPQPIRNITHTGTSTDVNELCADAGVARHAPQQIRNITHTGTPLPQAERDTAEKKAKLDESTSQSSHFRCTATTTAGTRCKRDCVDLAATAFITHAGTPLTQAERDTAEKEAKLEDWCLPSELD